MPLAGLLLAKARVRYAKALRVLSVVAVGALLLVVVPYVVRMFGIPLSNDDIPAGLTQRVVVVTEWACWPWRAWRCCGPPPAVCRPSPRSRSQA
ncbi:hypothetical protein GCM10020001_025180 [Nonomuraea salmonea]